jgi:hypothetical protein
MTKTAYLLVLAGLMVGICHLLPRSPPGRALTASLFVVIGFILAQGALSVAITALGLVPRGPFHEALEHLTDYDGDRPVALLVGSSFTQAGIDSEALGEILGTSGRGVVVLPLAIGGAPHLERLHHLKEYLSSAKRKPQIVLFEVAGGYDSGPLYQLHQMRFTDRMIAMMDGSSAWWAFRWLFSTDALGLTTSILLGGEILALLGLHVGHVGFLWNSTRADRPADYDPGSSPPQVHFTDDEVARLVDQAAETQDLKADWPPNVPTNWMAAFLEEEMSTLRRYGVDRFAFYSVPSMQGANVAYARRFCATMPGFACILGEDTQLLAGLRHAAAWYDFDHLQGEGRQLFTKWLGDRLVEQGLLP